MNRFTQSINRRRTARYKVWPAPSVRLRRIGIVSADPCIKILPILAKTACRGSGIFEFNSRYGSENIRLKADQPITHESIWSNGIGPSENCINGRSVQKEIVRACRRSRRQTSIFIANLNFEHPVRNEAIELAVTVIRKSLKSALNIRLFETNQHRASNRGSLNCIGATVHSIGRR